MSRVLFVNFLCLIYSLCNLVHGAVISGDDPVRIPFDWREHNVVSPVKDQKNCTACWAFSAIAAIESHLKIHLGQEEILSEQFLIDCDPSKVGCGSTSVVKAFSNIVSDFGGVSRDSDYPTPYLAKMGSCPNYSKANLIPVVGFRRVKPDEDAMMEYLYRYGPLSAAINSASMKKYDGGIDEPNEVSCPTEETDHAVLIVGYNIYFNVTTGKITYYWIIKNSWGKDWGDNGFYYLVIGRNACGIASDVSFPYVD